MQIWITQVMNEFGYVGIALLILLENVFPPIPSEVILTFGGFMTTYTTMTAVGVIGASTVGSVLGAIILYEAGKILSMRRLMKLADGRTGSLLHFKREDIQKAVLSFEKKGSYTVLFCRCVPIIRSLISIPAGISGMPMGRFLFLTAFGSTIWNTVLVLLGAAAGASWEKVVGYMDHYSSITIILLLLVFLVILVWFYKKHVQNSTS